MTRVVGGRYLVLDERSRDESGTVWRAEDRMTGGAVAVKELNLPVGLPAAQRLRFRERLLRETRAAGLLGAPGVVRVRDVVTDSGPDGVPHEHVVTELVEARTLAEVVAADGPLEAPRAAAVGRAVLATLRAAHAEGLVHRDVRPGTVLLGAGGRVWLADFGVAAAGEDAGAVPGTLPPEGRASIAGDLWALGAVLFHAVEGRSPGPEPRLSRARGSLAEAITGLLAPDPRRRLEAEAVAELLSEPTPRRSWLSVRGFSVAVLVLAVALAFAAGVLVGLAL